MAAQNSLGGHSTGNSAGVGPCQFDRSFILQDTGKVDPFSNAGTFADGSVFSNHGDTISETQFTDNDPATSVQQQPDDDNARSKRKRNQSHGTKLGSFKGPSRNVVAGKVSADERKKISRACDACKTRKSRCSGTIPCNRCNNLSISCTYDSPHKRGQPLSPTPARPARPSPERRDILSESALKSPSFWSPSGQLPAKAPSVLTEPVPGIQPFESLRSSQEREATVVEGQYIGPTSGIAFLHRAKGRLRQAFSSTAVEAAQNVSLAPSSIFSFGDNPSANYSAVPLVLPDRQQGREYVARYFDFAIPTYRFLHQSTVEGWLERLYDEDSNGSAGHGKRLGDGKAAVVLMVLATSTLYRVDEMGQFKHAEPNDFTQRWAYFFDDRQGLTCQSGLFFAAAERRLSTETGPARLESVQARLAQCLYLLGSSRTNQAWYLFGTTAQLILSLGLHSQRHSRISLNNPGLVETECRKRVFWSAYTLDKYFSVILGRPPIFRDEDIDQTLPSRVNDADLIQNTLKSRSAWNQCVMDAPVYHARLARIISSICTEIYSIHPISDETRISCAERRTTELKAWKESLPPFLDPAKVDPSILIPIFRRQSTVLKLAYEHAVILANRQFLLTNFADLSRPPTPTDLDAEKHIKQCVEAAFVSITTVNDFVEQGMMYKTFWFTHYISFCAIATLYVYTLRRIQAQGTASDDSDEEATIGASSRGKYFDAAERCQQLIASATETNSPSKRYSIILDELKRQVLAELEDASSDSSMHMWPKSNVGQREVNHGESTNQNVGSALHGSHHLQGIDVGLPVTRVDGKSTIIENVKFSSVIIPVLSEDNSLTSDQFGLPMDFIGWPELDSWAISWPSDSIGLPMGQSQDFYV